MFASYNVVMFKLVFEIQSDNFEETEFDTVGLGSHFCGPDM